MKAGGGTPAPCCRSAGIFGVIPRYIRVRESKVDSQNFKIFSESRESEVESRESEVKKEKEKRTMTTKYFKDFCSGVTAKIITHNDGTATLKVSYWKKAKKYKSYASAYNAWYRLCN